MLISSVARAVRRALGSALPGAVVEAFATANPATRSRFRGLFRDQLMRVEVGAWGIFMYTDIGEFFF